MREGNSETDKDEVKKDFWEEFSEEYTPDYKLDEAYIVDGNADVDDILEGIENEEINAETNKQAELEKAVEEEGDYGSLLRQLNETISESIKEKNSDVKERFLNQFHGKDIQQILMRVDEEIESISDIDDNARKVIRYMKNNRSLRNRIFLWYLEGEEDPSVLMSRYNDYCNEYSILRSVYMVQGLTKPLKIVLKKEKNIFPITSLIGLSEEYQTSIIKNILAAETRREYDIEKDSILKIQVYEIAKNRIVVLMSMFPFPGVDFGGVREILFKIFEGYKTIEGDIHSVNNVYIERMNRTIKNKARAYWDNILKNLPVAIKYPLQNNKGLEKEKESAYYSLENEIREGLLEYSKRSNIDSHIIMLKAWGELLCKYNETERAVIGVVNKGEALNVIPVVYNESMKTEEIHEQMDKSTVNSVCTLEELDEIAGHPAKKYYKGIHNFVDFSVIDEAVSQKRNGELLMFSYGDMDKIDPPLVINYYFFNDAININYIYKKGNFLDSDVPKLNKLFTETLRDIIELKKATFVEEKISESKDSEKNNEQMKRIVTAKRAVLLKEIRIFDKLEIEEIMDLSAKCGQSRFAKNDVVISALKSKENIYVITEGIVLVTKIEQDGRVTPLFHMKKGDMLGMDALFRTSEIKLSFNYIAISDQVQVISIPVKEIDVLGEKYSDIYKKMLKKMIGFINTYFQGR